MCVCECLRVCACVSVYVSVSVVLFVFKCVCMSECVVFGNLSSQCPLFAEKTLTREVVYLGVFV